MEIRRNTTRQVKQEGNTISGYAALFYDGTPATEYKLWEGAVERIDPHAFDRALQEKQDVRASFDHNLNTLLGRTSSGTLELSIDKVGVRYDIKFDPTDPDHQRVAAKIKRGDVSGSSFMALARHQWTEDRSGSTVGTIVDLDLIELGPVTMPAYENTSAGFRSEGSDDAKKSYEEWKAEKVTEDKIKMIEKLTI